MGLLSEPFHREGRKCRPPLLSFMGCRWKNTSRVLYRPARSDRPGSRCLSLWSKRDNNDAIKMDLARDPRRAEPGREGVLEADRGRSRRDSHRPSHRPSRPSADLAEARGFGALSSAGAPEPETSPDLSSQLPVPGLGRGADRDDPARQAQQPPAEVPAHRSRPQPIGRPHGGALK